MSCSPRLTCLSLQITFNKAGRRKDEPGSRGFFLKQSDACLHQWLTGGKKMTWGVSLADQTGFCTWRRNKVFSYLRREWSWDFAGELKKKTGESLILFCCTFWNYTKKGGLMRPCWGSGWRLKLSKWGESIVRSLLLRCLSFALNVQCVRAFFRGNVGVVQRRGYTFTSRPAGVPTVSRWHTQTHTHVHKGINCVQFRILSYWPTATGRLSRWRRPDQIQGWLSRLGESNWKGSLSPSLGGGTDGPVTGQILVSGISL